MKCVLTTKSSRPRRGKPYKTKLDKVLNSGVEAQCHLCQNPHALYGLSQMEGVLVGGRSLKIDMLGIRHKVIKLELI